MAKTKEKSTSEMVTTLSAQAKELTAELEAILEGIVTENRTASIDELIVLQSRFGLGTDEVAAQVRRVSRKLHNQAIAGTPEQRAEAKALLASTTTALKTDGAKILEQIETLQKQHAKLEREASQSERRYAEMCAAAKLLPDLMDANSKKQRALKRKAVKETLGRAFLDLEARRSEIEGLLSQPSRDDPRAMLWVDAWRRFSPEAFEQSEQGWLPTSTYDDECESIRDEMKAIDKELPAAKSAFDKALAELEVTL